MGLLAALLLVQSTEGNVASSSPSPPRSCADSATLEYPAGTVATAASTACGPHTHDLSQCQALCDDTAGCTAITFYSDNGCRLYSACSAADPCPFCVATSIYIRDSV